MIYQEETGNQPISTEELIKWFRDLENNDTQYKEVKRNASTISQIMASMEKKIKKGGRNEDCEMILRKIADKNKVKERYKEPWADLSSLISLRHRILQIQSRSYNAQKKT